jgi:hypothetical protein
MLVSGRKHRILLLAVRSMPAHQHQDDLSEEATQTKFPELNIVSPYFSQKIELTFKLAFALESDLSNLPFRHSLRALPATVRK